ncbi:hypothetical protein [Bradyrhizobium sp. CCBAU 051011]|uniref:hypothetical protein n=1 Tax=Bradyrhizobium sp. CCBAU 051011 TaxID=858422 RepID=UPI00192A4F07|nr:hypothetical protein [Bradyrhizobium sp. CCBAU 051011]
MRQSTSALAQQFIRAEEFNATQREGLNDSHGLILGQDNGDHSGYITVGGAAEPEYSRQMQAAD